MAIDVQILADALPSFLAALREAELEYERLHTSYLCAYCGATLTVTEEGGHTRAHAIDLLRAGNMTIQQVADALQITFGRVAAYKRRAGIVSVRSHKAEPKNVEPPKPASVIAFPRRPVEPVSARKYEGEPEAFEQSHTSAFTSTLCSGGFLRQGTKPRTSEQKG